jgi:hypothetical protein
VKCDNDTDTELQDSLTIKWFKDGIELKKDDRILRTPQELIIQNLQTSDTGSYNCKVSTKIDQIESNPVILETYKNSKSASK